MIITKPFIFDILINAGYIPTRTTKRAGYRRKHIDGLWHKPFIYGYLKRYSGRNGTGFVMECSTEGNNIYGNHKNIYYIKKEGL